MNGIGRAAAIGFAFAALTTAARAQTPQRIPAPGGEVVLTTLDDHRAYDEFGYSVARRAGDYVYVSGVVIRRLKDRPATPETFKAQARLAFAKIAGRLAPFGATLADVVMINSFHDWSAPEFEGQRAAQFAAFDAVKQEAMGKPHPAWTAVGTTGLLGEGGIVEVQMIAYAPVRR